MPFFATRFRFLEQEVHMRRFTLVLAAVFFGLSSSPGRAQSGTHTVTCGPEKTIGQAIKMLKAGDTLLVSGTCNENLTIGQEVERITLDGQGTEIGRASCRERGWGARKACTWDKARKGGVCT